MNIERDDLLRLASDLTDELKVDWLGERAARPDVAKILEELESLERFARVQRAARERRAPREALFAWGPLRATARLGEGGAAEVWRAWEPALQREVALKLRRAGDDVAGSSARRWLEEARRLARVRHPHVLSVYGADVHDGRAGLWCELIEGRTLETQLGESGVLGPREAAVLGMDLCGALAAIHAAGLLHGDVKASNVMRETGGRVVLMDLGAGSELLPGDAGPAPVEFATPQGAAPEVLRGEGASPRSDLWSLGALLYRLLTGHHVVEGAGFREVRERLERGERLPLRDRRPDLPADLVQVIEQALATGPEGRFASAGAMEQALARTLSTRPETPAARAPFRRRTALVAGATTGVLVLLVATWLALRGAGGPDAGAPAGPVAARPPAANSAEPTGAGAPAGTRGEASPATAAPAAQAPAFALYATRESTAVALRAEAGIAPGDRLFLEVQAGEDAWVYVLDEDEAGQVFVLFPQAGFEPANPLAGGVRHRLPGRRDGEVRDWEVTTAGGREHLLVVATAGRNAALEEAVAKLAAGGRLAGAAPPRGPRRGIGGSAPSTAPGTEPANLKAVERLLDGDRRAGRAWLRSWTLDNPR